MKLLDTLKTQLAKADGLTDGKGTINRQVVINKAQNFDDELLKVLLSNKELRRTFFVESAGHPMFHLLKFLHFVDQKAYTSDSYTRYKNKVGLEIDGKYLRQRNEVSLVWPYKDCILEGGQSREEQKRSEIFFNQVLAQDEITQLLEPKVLSRAKTYDKKGEHAFKAFQRDAAINKKRELPEDTITDNLLIKGNNLLALHSLQREFAGKVKLIYIDPPYNTGNDGFQYNDNFNHSSWLTFMKNRLEAAKVLLRDDGVIFVQCDDNEQAYLKVLLDEVFGRENFVANCVVIINRGGRDYGGIARTHEYVLSFSKTEQYELNGIQEKDKRFPMQDDDGGFEPRELRNRNILFNKGNRPNLCYPFYLNPANSDDNGLLELSLEKKKDWIEVYPLKSQGVQTVWRWGKERASKYLNSDVKGKKKAGGGYMIIQKYRSATRMQRSVFDDKTFVNERGTEHIKEMFGGKIFAYPKSEYFLNRIVELATSEHDIILDYHLGSGTTAAVAHKMNRQYIGIEQMDYIETVAKARLQKVIEGEQGGISKAMDWNGGGSFTYFELKKYNQTFIDRIEAAKSAKVLLEIWEKMKAHSFLDYNVDIKKQQEHMADFKELPLAEQKQHLLEILDKNQLYVNLSSLHDQEFACSAAEKKVTEEFYQ